MKARIPGEYVVVFFETDLSKSGPFDESQMSGYQKCVFLQLGEQEREKIRLGYGAGVRDMSGNNPDCSFNMEGYVPPKSAIENLARTLLPSIQAFYADEKNRKACDQFFSKQEQSQKKCDQPSSEDSL